MWLAVGMATAAVAIFSLLPRVLSMRFTKIVRRAYRRFEVIEKAGTKGGDQQAILAELDELEDLTANLRVPMSSLETDWFELRQHIHDVRDQVESLSS